MAFRLLWLIGLAAMLAPVFSAAAPGHAKSAKAPSAEAGAAADVERGRAIFETICIHCHRTDDKESAVGAPGLRGVSQRHDDKWLGRWLKNPSLFSKTDETAMALTKSNRFGLVMPVLPEMQDAKNRRDVIAYLKTLK